MDLSIPTTPSCCSYKCICHFESNKEIGVSNADTLFFGTIISYFLFLVRLVGCRLVGDVIFFSLIHCSLVMPCSLLWWCQTHVNNVSSGSFYHYDIYMIMSGMLIWKHVLHDFLRMDMEQMLPHGLQDCKRHLIGSRASKLMLTYPEKNFSRQNQNIGTI